MRFSPYLLFLLAFSPSYSSASSLRTITNLHSIAIKHSAGIARDIRRALSPLLISQPTNQGQQKIYCVTKPLSPGGSSRNGTTGHPTSSKVNPTKTGAPPAPTGSSPWSLVQNHEGQGFFDGWEFWTFPDPTHGVVDYVSEDTGRANGLVAVNAQGNAVMRVDTTQQVSGNRQSIRITTTQSFMGGLVIMDAVHMPTGCATWPAFWSNGPDWPVGGEIDIVEGVNNYTNNQLTIHTNPGCSLPSTNSANLAITGSVVGGTNCAAAQTGNQGCGVRAPNNNTFGVGFNRIGGGVYATQWDKDGITIWFFPRGSIPTDISAGAPQSQNWGMPVARWPASTCDPFKFFVDHVAIFDTTLCGDWAGAVWSASGIPGQEQSCADRTGFSTCEAFVRARGDSFAEAYWEVRNVKIYKQK